jgi:hypothetical protein
MRELGSRIHALNQMPSKKDVNCPSSARLKRASRMNPTCADEPGHDDRSLFGCLGLPAVRRYVKSATP